LKRRELSEDFKRDSIRIVSTSGRSVAVVADEPGSRRQFDDGIAVGRHRVARLMRENGLKARQRTRFKRITDSRHDQPIAPNLLEQDFTCDGTEQKWGADIGYIWTTDMDNGRLALSCNYC